MEPLFRFRRPKETAPVRTNTIGRLMRISTGPRTVFLLFMIVLDWRSPSPMAIPRQCQRCRGESRQRNCQDRDEREKVAPEKQRGEKPHEHAVEGEHGD